MNNETLRDEIAMRCPDSEINRRYPTAAKFEHELMVELGLIGPETPVMGIPEKAKGRLRALIRYQYADDMIEARSRPRA